VTNQVLGGVLLALGSVVLLLVIFAPKYLAYVPGNRWFWPAGPRATRFGSTAGGSACVVLGLVALDAIPEQALGTVLVLLAAVIVAAAIYDFSRPNKLSNPAQPVAYSKTNGSQKRRKRRRR
jgi:hypothetical protein